MGVGKQIEDGPGGRGEGAEEEAVQGASGCIHRIMTR